MSIYQDHFSTLSELERLAAMVQDPVRVHELGADQWPMAMMAFGLLTSNDEGRFPEVVDAYHIFVSKTPAAARKSSMVMLQRFITARKGEGWRALLPYALCEPDAALSRKAGQLVATLAKPDEFHKFPGVDALASLLVKRADAPATLLEALLSLSDMRFLPAAETLFAMDAGRLEALVSFAALAPNRLSCTWLLDLLKACPAMSACVTSAFVAMAPQGVAVMDLVLPVPTWAFAKPAPQPLHGWTLPEYFPRMEEALRPYLDDRQLAAVRSAFGA